MWIIGSSETIMQLSSFLLAAKWGFIYGMRALLFLSKNGTTLKLSLFLEMILFNPKPGDR
jgi:hypothetical protein